MRVDLRLVAAVAAGALVLAAAGCGGGKEPIRIGFLADCGGIFGGTAVDFTLAGVELPLLARGAKLAGKKPSDGVVDATIAGRPVELVPGCSLWGVHRQLIEQTRWLIEEKGVDIVIGPTIGATEGLVLREVARRHPDVTFLLGLSGAQETTLRDPAPNVFRFGADSAQTSAGLGAYAYHDLGWRKVAVVAADYVDQWAEAAGFIAEFCALGGRVDRIESPPFATAAVAAQIPRDVDGVALMGQGFGDTLGFAAAYAKVHPDLARRVVLGRGFFDFLDPKLLASAGAILRGAVASSNLPSDADPAWRRFRASYAEHFPGFPPAPAPSGFPFVVEYYNAATATFKALEAVDGDLSDGEQRFREALARVRLDSPVGPIRLDRNRQAIVSNYLTRIQGDPQGKPTLKTLRTVPNVEQTFGGYFSGSTPPPTKSTPACHRAEPPPWAR